MNIKSLEEAQKELRQVNNNLTLLMKSKRALKQFIEDEIDRIDGKPSPKSRAYELKKDKEFVSLYGRERTCKEIGRVMGYSERQIQRFLEEKED